MARMTGLRPIVVSSLNNILSLKAPSLLLLLPLPALFRFILLPFVGLCSKRPPCKVSHAQACQEPHGVELCNAASQQEAALTLVPGNDVF